MLAAAAWFSAGAAQADEGGASFWLPGQFGSFAAIAPAPGFSLSGVSFYYNGKIDASVTLPLGLVAAAGLKGDYFAQFIVPNWAPKGRILGAQPSLSLGIVPAHSTASAQVSINGRAIRRSDKVSGFADLYPTFQLNWANKSNNYMAYVTGAVPVGNYNPSRLANLGLGHGAIDFGGGYTYLNETTGLEFSATAGLTFNFVNPDTRFRNGTNLHVDVGVAQFLSEQAFVGLNGFYYQQISNDKGGLALLRDVRSRVIGIGPQAGYNFMAGETPIFASIRGYYEVDAVKRLKGGSVMLTVSIPISQIRASRGG